MQGRYQARFVPAAVAKAAQYEQVDKLLGERNSPRNIVRVTGVARMTVASRVKKSLVGLATTAPVAAEKSTKKRWEVLKLDELWTFVGRKKRKIRLWLAVERASRRILA